MHTHTLAFQLHGFNFRASASASASALIGKDRTSNKQWFGAWSTYPTSPFFGDFTRVLNDYYEKFKSNHE